MNGRIYEPTLGRMLSPDPVTQAPDNGQNYNRYSYAFNNPLRYTDPSGYCARRGPTPEFGAFDNCQDHDQKNYGNQLGGFGPSHFIGLGWLMNLSLEDYIEVLVNAGAPRSKVESGPYFTVRYGGGVISQPGDRVEDTNGDPVNSGSGGNSPVHDAAVTIGEEVASIAVGSIADELLNLPGIGGLFTTVGVDIATDKSGDELFSGGAGASAAWSAYFATNGAFVLPVGVGLLVPIFVDHVVNDLAAPDCSLGARCPTDEFFNRNGKQD